MAVSMGRGEDEPMGEMNTTPLIDVMLVLLVMFILTIPIQTHAVKIDLPAQTPPDTPKPPIDPVVNNLTIASNASVLWNGTPINLATLKVYLDRTRVMSPEPELHFQPDPYARFDTVDRVLAVVKRIEVTKFGFVGNENYYNYDK